MAAGFYSVHPIFGFGATPPPAGFRSLLAFWMGGASVASGTFPAQFFGLRAKTTSAIIDLCLVATADAPGTLGAVRVQKNGVIYAVYLVDITDPLASPIRVQTTAGIKAIRLKT